MSTIKKAVHTVVKPECGKKVYDIIQNEDLFANLSPMPNAIESIERLVNNSRLDTYIVTAYSGNGDMAKGKIRWIKKNMPFFDTEYVILCKPKHLVYGNVLLDDAVKNLTSWFEAQQSLGNDDVHPIAMAASHNEDADKEHSIDARVSGWTEFMDYLGTFIL